MYEGIDRTVFRLELGQDGAKKSYMPADIQTEEIVYAFFSAAEDLKLSPTLNLERGGRVRNYSVKGQPGYGACMKVSLGDDERTLPKDPISLGQGTRNLKLRILKQ